MVTKRQLNCIPRLASGFKRRKPVVTPMFRVLGPSLPGRFNRGSGKPMARKIGEVRVAILRSATGCASETDE
jgi:hypothetical protein